MQGIQHQLLNKVWNINYNKTSWYQQAQLFLVYETDALTATVSSQVQVTTRQPFTETATQTRLLCTIPSVDRYLQEVENCSKPGDCFPGCLERSSKRRIHQHTLSNILTCTGKIHPASRVTHGVFGKERSNLSFLLFRKLEAQVPLLSRSVWQQHLVHKLWVACAFIIH